MEILVLGLVAGLSFLSYALWKRAQADASAPSLPGRPALLGPTGDADLLTLRPGDVVTHLATDYIVEGALTLDDDGRLTRLYRLADGARVRWLGVRPGQTEPLVLDHAPGVPVERNAPEQLHFGGLPYKLLRRVHTRVRRQGTIGSGPAERPGERAWLYEYSGAGAACLLAVAWVDATEAFIGEPVHRTLIDVLPGS